MIANDSAWFVYVLRCGDGTLYTGISTDVERRIKEHEGVADKGAKYLKGRAPLSLAFQYGVANRSIASKLEYRIKKLSRDEKEALVNGDFELNKLLEHC